jgi:hypothetical protein
MFTQAEGFCVIFQPSSFSYKWNEAFFEKIQLTKILKFERPTLLNDYKFIAPKAMARSLAILSMREVRFSHRWNMSMFQNNLIFLSSRFPIRVPFACFFFPIHVIHSAHLICIYLITRTIFGEQHICYFLQSHFASSFLDPNISPNNL